MAKLVQYIDREKATVAVLRDYLDQMWKLENDPLRIRELDAALASPHGPRLDGMPRGGARGDENLARALDRKSLLEQGYSQAVDYSDEFGPCWKRLSAEQRDLLTLRFVDSLEGGGIGRIMDKYAVSKSEAYNRSNEALRRLSLLLFW